MKKIITILIAGLVLITIQSFSQAPNWEWAKSTGKSGGDIPSSVVTDSYGNVYVCGTFRDTTITFGSTILTNNYLYTSDIFLAKYDNLGNVLWAKKVGGNSDDLATSIAVDTIGNIYFTGAFKSDTIYFGSISLIKSYQSFNAIFIAKYDSSGNALWAKNFGGFYDQSKSIATDKFGNVYIAGDFQDSTITFDTVTLNGGGPGNEIFIIKFDSLGHSLWGKSAGGSNDNRATSVATDANGNVYMTGHFCCDTISFGSYTFINSGSSSTGDMFIVKYDSFGNLIWAKTAKGSDYERPTSVKVDNSGYVYLTGIFMSPIVIFGSDTLTNISGGEGFFLIKYDSLGNIVWAKSVTGTIWEETTSIACDNNGNIYLTGWFESPVMTFGSVNLINSDPGSRFIFIIKCDSSGNAHWGESKGIWSDNEACSTSIDEFGNLYIAGYFESPSIPFGSTTLILNGITSIFLAKLNSTTGINQVPHTNSAISLFPNPASTTITIHQSTQSTNSTNQQLTITDVFGRIVYAQLLNPSTNTTESTNTTIDLNLSNGIYLWEVNTAHEVSAVGKLVIIK